MGYASFPDSELDSDDISGSSIEVRFERDPTVPPPRPIFNAGGLAPREAMGEVIKRGEAFEEPLLCRIEGPALRGEDVDPLGRPLPGN
jgi:hypothetical protein